MFELTQSEYDVLRSQIGTLKRGQHSKYLPMAFTEHIVLQPSQVITPARVFYPLLQTLDNIQHAMN